MHETIKLKPHNETEFQALANCLVKLGEWSAAEQFLSAAVQQYPDQGVLHLNLGQTLIEGSLARNKVPNWSRAGQEFAIAIDLAKDGTGATSPRRNIVIELCPHPELFDSVSKLRPQDPTVWFGHGEFQALHNRWTAAVADFARVIKPYPASNLAVEYAYLLLLTNNVSGYRQFCQELLDRSGDPNDPRVAGNLAMVCCASQDMLIDPQRVVG